MVYKQSCSLMEQTIMLFVTLLSVLSSNAVSNTKEKSIIFSRLIIISLTFSIFVIQNSLIIKSLNKTINLYGSLFNVDLFTQSSSMFILFTACGILILSGFYSKSFFSSLLSPELTEKQEINDSSDRESISVNKKSDIYNITEYALIVLFIIYGAVSLISASDLISIFLSIELQSYGLYILCTLHRDSELGTGSALMYFLLGGLSSCFILFGFAVLYANSGTTNLDNIYIMFGILQDDSTTATALNILNRETLNNLSYNHYYITISFIMIMVGFLFKVSAAPFHFWSPTVYDGIPTVVTTFVAIIAKISIFAFILIVTLQLSFAQLPYIDDIMSVNSSHSPANHLELDVIDTNQEENSLKISDASHLESSYDPSEMESFIYKYAEWKNVILLSSLLSLLIGSLLGLTQNRIKRLFAYSTISHVGFILLALSITTMESIQGYIFYILQYTISNLNIFLVLISIGYTLSNYKYKGSAIKGTNLLSQLKDNAYSPIQLISQMKGYFYVNNLLAISFAVTLFSFVGIPPLIGFFAKQIVLSAALDSGYVFITFVAIITSVIGAVYYLNLIKEVFFNETDYTLTNNNVNQYKAISIQSRASLHKRGGERETDSFRVNSTLSAVIGFLTIIILTFMYKPSDWFIIANILSITLFNL